MLPVDPRKPSKELERDRKGAVRCVQRSDLEVRQIKPFSQHVHTDDAIELPLPQPLDHLLRMALASPAVDDLQLECGMLTVDFSKLIRTGPRVGAHHDGMGKS